MKKATLITLLAVAIGQGVFGQTTNPVISKVAIERIAGMYIDNGATIQHHYDYYFSPNINGIALRAWANNYHGKWYSNYPYTVKFFYNRHIVQLYDRGVFVYAFAESGYSWYNKTYFNQK
jgi:hypothetical protein